MPRFRLHTGTLGGDAGGHRFLSTFLASLSAVLLSVASCSEPPSMERYVLTKDAAGGEYVFPLEMDDTTCTYDVDLLVVEDTSLPRRGEVGGLPLGMRWRTPSGGEITEKVWMGREEDVVYESYFTRHLRASYRLGMKPSEHGGWTLAVSVPEDIASSHRLRGIGLSLRKNPPQVPGEAD